MGLRLRRTRRFFLGDRPRAVLRFVVPTFLAIALDVVLRGRSLLVFPPKEWLNYFGSSLASAGFWGDRSGSRPPAAGEALAARGSLLALYAALFVFPLATFSLRRSAPLLPRLSLPTWRATRCASASRLRGTLGAWLASWGGVRRRHGWSSAS